MNGKESESINAMVVCDKKADNIKERLSAYDSKGEGKTSGKSEKKEKTRDGYVRMYECNKHSLHSTFECACVVQETTKSKVKYIVEIYHFKIR